MRTEMNVSIRPRVDVIRSPYPHYIMGGLVCLDRNPEPSRDFSPRSTWFRHQNNDLEPRTHEVGRRLIAIATQTTSLVSSAIC